MMKPMITITWIQLEKALQEDHHQKVWGMKNWIFGISAFHILCCVSWCCADTFTLGYLTGSERRPWDKEYSRPGLSISGMHNVQSYLLDMRHLAETFSDLTY